MNPLDPRSARSLRTAQRLLNQSSTAGGQTESPSGAGGNAGTGDTGNATDTDQINQLRAEQNKILEQLKNLSDAIYQISSTQTNVASIRIEQVSEVYFTRQVRPLLDALYFISISSLNIAGVAQALQNNTFGERKELRNALELVYSMNHEIDSIIDGLSRRLKIYLHQLKEMDKNCPPFVNIREDS
jgi:phosphate uptake regulator